MGSSGSGRISDYPGSSGTGSGASKGGGDGSAGGSDRCAQAIAVALEDIEHCDFYKGSGTVPAPGQQLRIAHKKRVVAETDTGITVGNLPTAYHISPVASKRAGRTPARSRFRMARGPSPQYRQSLHLPRTHDCDSYTCPSLVGEVFVDFTITPPGTENKLRLGGVAHAARGFWAIGQTFRAAVVTPSIWTITRTTSRSLDASN